MRFALKVGFSEDQKMTVVSRNTDLGRLYPKPYPPNNFAVSNIRRTFALVKQR